MCASLTLYLYLQISALFHLSDSYIKKISKLSEITMLIQIERKAQNFFRSPGGKARCTGGGRQDDVIQSAAVKLWSFLFEILKCTSQNATVKLTQFRKNFTTTEPNLTSPTSSYSNELGRMNLRISISLYEGLSLEI